MHILCTWLRDQPDLHSENCWFSDILLKVTSCLFIVLICTLYFGIKYGTISYPNHNPYNSQDEDSAGISHCHCSCTSRSVLYGYVPVSVHIWPATNHKKLKILQLRRLARNLHRRWCRFTWRGPDHNKNSQVSEEPAARPTVHASATWVLAPRANIFSSPSSSFALPLLAVSPP